MLWPIITLIDQSQSVFAMTLAGSSLEHDQLQEQGKFQVLWWKFLHNCRLVLQTGKNQIRLEGPPVLDEGAIELEDKHSWWPFMEPGGGKFERGSGL